MFLKGQKLHEQKTTNKNTANKTSVHYVSRPSILGSKDNCFSENCQYNNVKIGVNGKNPSLQQPVPLNLGQNLFISNKIETFVLSLPFLYEPPQQQVTSRLRPETSQNKSIECE
jgi:hypothetical protein